MKTSKNKNVEEHFESVPLITPSTLKNEACEPTPPERKISIDLNKYVDGLQLTVIEAKKLHLYIRGILRNHHKHGSLAEVDEADILIETCERILDGRRNWNKDKCPSALMFFKGCARSIISARGKSQENKNNQKTASLTQADNSNAEYLTPDNNFSTPEEEHNCQELKEAMLFTVAKTNPQLVNLAKVMILGGKYSYEWLSKEENYTEKKLINGERLIRRITKKYMEGL